ncbi:hypothetical protein BJB45_19195 [Halomonas huangheensis]|uniref:Hemin uptake protein HemP n=2 Tax=Halomonas huangheensis TaxID=1178482 RepID=W1N6F0_9GAMM|nr:hypothetical protein AR456_19375 [Halomonas huangheensis]ERL51098.1 hypothetical protein BJB45_19195 [Halomonas huangheensis]
MVTSPDTPQPSSQPTNHGPRPRWPTVISSSELLGDDDQLIIEHNGQHYRLRRTRQNKLILTL